MAMEAESKKKRGRKADGESSVEIVETSTTPPADAEGATEAESSLPYRDDEAGRHVTIEGLGSVVIHLPSLADQEEAEWEYSRVYMEGLKRGLPVRKEIERLLTQRGIILNTERRDEIAKQLRAYGLELQEILQDLHGEDPDEATQKRIETIQRESEQLREQYAALQAEDEEYFGHTAEKKAEQARLVYLAALCTEWDEPGKSGRVWPTAQEFLRERRTAVVTTVLAHFMAMVF